ncbi:tRNA lysidine(34) synthetase TilS [Shigella flexneri]
MRSKRQDCCIFWAQRRRELKKIWQGDRVPPWLRDTTPLLFYGERSLRRRGLVAEGVAEGEMA